MLQKNRMGRLLYLYCMEESIMKDYKVMKNRGITLIALVVTIIVLLILARHKY